MEIHVFCLIRLVLVSSHQRSSLPTQELLGMTLDKREIDSDRIAIPYPAACPFFHTENMLLLIIISIVIFSASFCAKRTNMPIFVLRVFRRLVPAGEANEWKG